MRCVIGFLIMTLTLASPAAAETMEVAPGVRVTKKTYPVPDNEQPFFGFVTKTPARIAADEKFVTQIVQLSGSRQGALDEALKRGWGALLSGDAVTASRRFNQAYLIGPEQSGIYHAFAALVQTRFNDTEYADELFRVALKQPNPPDTLRADYGRLLWSLSAQPMLDHFSNMQWSRPPSSEMPGPISLLPDCRRATL